LRNLGILNSIFFRNNYFMMKMFVYSLIVSILTQPFALAQEAKGKAYVPGIASGEAAGERGAAEFVMRRFPGERLIPVRILGGVKSPGTYYFPEGMDLLSAISLSGGIEGTADHEAVRWTQFSSQKDSKLNMEEIMRRPKELNPTLGANDILYVEPKTTWFSNNFLATLSVIVSVTGLALSARALSR